MGKLSTFVEELQHIRTSHHITNIILCLCFYVSKLISPLCEILYRRNIQCHIDQREHEVMIFLAFIIFWKNRRAASWLHYLSNVFVFTKLANLILFYRLDPRVALVYGVICIIQVVLFPEPAYQGPEKIVYFRNVEVHEELESNKRVTWLIEFFTVWSPECRQVASTFAKISHKYSLPNLKFGKLDVGRWEKEAERFRINIHPTSRQLPTVSLFQAGKEVRRRPLVNAKGRAIPFAFKEENLVSDFDLNNLYNECKERLTKQEKDEVVHSKSE